eukprot:TsM_000819700 transcript=TsM_000819700 gene=TsM_000819700
MAFQVCLLLLAVSVLAGSSETAVRRTPRASSLQRHFKWGLVTPHSIHLSWSAQALNDAPDGVVTMEAVSAADPTTTKLVSAYVKEGEATLTGLTPNSLYNVTVTASYKGYTFINFTSSIQTPSA